MPSKEASDLLSLFQDVAHNSTPNPEWDPFDDSKPQEVIWVAQYDLVQRTMELDSSHALMCFGYAMGAAYAWSFPKAPAETPAPKLSEPPPVPDEPPTPPAAPEWAHRATRLQHQALHSFSLALIAIAALMALAVLTSGGR